MIESKKEISDHKKKKEPKNWYDELSEIKFIANQGKKCETSSGENVWADVTSKKTEVGKRSGTNSSHKTKKSTKGCADVSSNEISAWGLGDKWADDSLNESDDENKKKWILKKGETSFTTKSAVKHDDTSNLEENDVKVFKLSLEFIHP